MAAVAEAVGGSLAEADPDHAADYEANVDELRAELDELDADYRAGLADCDTDTVVVSHDAFGYLAKYGLVLEPIAGLSPDAEPSPAHLAELQQLIGERGVTTVFSETLASPELADTLARDLGLDSAVLDPIEGLSDDTADEDYLSLMRSNLSALRTANGCT
jgi:zinc transport system substrate-binding protein